MIDKKTVAIITMGQSGEASDDIVSAMPNAAAVKYGILDGMTLEDVKRDIWPKGDETFIVSNLADGTNVKIAERFAMDKANELILKAEEDGASAALIVCTGRFDPPETGMTLIVPERILLAVLGALGVTKLGVIVPEPEQIAMTEEYYARYSPVVRAASPYGGDGHIAQAASLFADEPVDLILSDCMGFNARHGAIIAKSSGKSVFVPRAVLPALINAMMI